LAVTLGGLALGGVSQMFARERTLESPTGLSAGVRPALRQTACCAIALCYRFSFLHFF